MFTGPYALSLLHQEPEDRGEDLTQDVGRSLEKLRPRWVMAAVRAQGALASKPLRGLGAARPRETPASGRADGHLAHAWQRSKKQTTKGLEPAHVYEVSILTDPPYR